MERGDPSGRASRGERGRGRLRLRPRAVFVRTREPPRVRSALIEATCHAAAHASPSPPDLAATPTGDSRWRARTRPGRPVRGLCASGEHPVTGSPHGRARPSPRAQPYRGGPARAGDGCDASDPTPHIPQAGSAPSGAPDRSPRQRPGQLPVRLAATPRFGTVSPSRRRRPRGPTRQHRPGRGLWRRPLRQQTIWVRSRRRDRARTGPWTRSLPDALRPPLWGRSKAPARQPCRTWPARRSQRRRARPRRHLDRSPPPLRGPRRLRASARPCPIYRHGCATPEDG